MRCTLGGEFILIVCSFDRPRRIDISAVDAKYNNKYIEDHLIVDILQPILTQIDFRLNITHYQLIIIKLIVIFKLDER